MGMDIYAHVKVGNRFEFASNEIFKDLSYVWGIAPSFQLSTPVRRLFIHDIGVMTMDELNAYHKSFTKEEHGAVIQYLNANTCPEYMPQDMYSELVEFLSRAWDNDLYLNVG